MTTDLTLLDLDPRTLVERPDDVRTEVGDVSDLAATMREVGVLEPLIVTQTDDGHQIVAGRRRRMAAIEADLPTVPCILRDDLASDAGQTAFAALVENTKRAALSPGEEARGIQQLRLAGWNQVRIRTALGTTRQHVRTALAVAGNDTALAAAQEHPITLDQALVIGEFADDEKAVEALTALAVKEPGRFAHLASRLRAEREVESERRAVVDDLVAKGITVLGDDDEPGAPLHRLDHDGERLTEATHAQCPGHAAVVEASYGEPEITFVCADPEAHGHTDRWAASGSGNGGTGGGLSDEQKAERREVVANNRAWRAAEAVRLEHVASVLGRRNPPVGTLRFVAEEVMADPTLVGHASDGDLARVTGRPDEAGTWDRALGRRLATEATDKRLPVVLLAQVAASVEARMGVHTWRHHHPTEARYLRFLCSTGYTLSDVEQIVVDTDEATATAA